MDGELLCAGVDGEVYSAMEDLGGEVPCAESDAAGDMPCIESDAAGEMPCAENDAAGDMPCTENDAAGDMPCTENDAAGDMPCAESDAAGDMPCAESKAAGDMPCAETNPKEEAPHAESSVEGEMPSTDGSGEGEMPCAESDAKGEASCYETDEEEEPATEIPVASKRMYSISSPLRAIIRLRRRYHGQKKSRLHLELPREKPSELVHTRLLQRQLSLNRTGLYGPSMSLFNQSSFETSQYFTFDTSVDQYVMKKCRRKKNRRKSRIVLYPDKTKRYLPTEEKSKAKRCLLLLIVIIFFQILNAIENLDDNLQKYDLDGLEKTMHREVFGQKVAVESIMELLKDYLATHIHNKPLVISLNGPTGVGKSHVGWLLAKHFRSIMDNDFVLQYFVMHHCPSGVAPLTCEIDLSKKISDMVTRAEIEEKIPLFILDEVELMSPVLLDTLSRFFEPNQTNEFLNAIYILISNIGGGEITKFVIQNASAEILHQQRGAEELLSIIQPVLIDAHPLWKSADIIPFILLEKTHVINCFLEEMRREGLYPDQKHVENLASQLSYYTTEGKQYSRMGCKQVVAKVNLL
ncbi:torsin-4A [Strigops habroptila]|uniref:Torsin family 4 member A n=1 Tax=Strigops habroptila TaxID=2489341 RepID=A0A672TVQ1_STRHB|nr:torsin-4A [Strigops habroptila]XP_030363293.1 torsin-4A [Strigops habroptila]XP_030363294.1 torsin-4A [Strigops habroptila]XP_030363295.1 torsin-4A [Strigops habroptila]